MELDELLRRMVEAGASDLFLKAGSVGGMRVNGEIQQLSGGPLSDAEALALCEVAADRQLGALTEVDCAYVCAAGRFRVNVYRQQGQWGLVARHVATQIPSFEALGLPAQQLRVLAERRRGLVLVTGIAGSGKSTTLAAMVEHLNLNHPRHVVTIEDPVEYQFEEKRCLISQREVGIDTPDFASALRFVVRQSPDVILIGELRDRETMRTAISAAETGHLVLSTLHTVNAVQTVERMINYFPTHEHDLVRLQLSLGLAGVISQRLLPAVGGGRVPACELLLRTPMIEEVISEGRTRDIARALEESAKHYGTCTFNQDLKRLVDEGRVSIDSAVESSDNSDELRLALRGISHG